MLILFAKYRLGFKTNGFCVLCGACPGILLPAFETGSSVELSDKTKSPAGLPFPLSTAAVDVATAVVAAAAAAAAVGKGNRGGGKYEKKNA